LDQVCAANSVIHFGKGEQFGCGLMAALLIWTKHMLPTASSFLGRVAGWGWDYVGLGNLDQVCAANSVVHFGRAGITLGVER
jgi:hypothetical protein